MSAQSLQHHSSNCQGDFIWYEIGSNDEDVEESAFLEVLWRDLGKLVFHS
jgi:hypothetical protein